MERVLLPVGWLFQNNPHPATSNGFEDRNWRTKKNPQCLFHLIQLYTFVSLSFALVTWKVGRIILIASDYVDGIAVPDNNTSQISPPSASCVSLKVSSCITTSKAWVSTLRRNVICAIKVINSGLVSIVAIEIIEIVQQTWEWFVPSTVWIVRWPKMTGSSSPVMGLFADRSFVIVCC